jgi:ABC-type transporter MlaC component
MNQTYLGYGKDGSGGKARQKEQDLNAAALSGEVLAQRAAAKASPQYSNSAWDLVDAKKAGQVKLEEMAESELPQEMKGMSAQERNEYVAALQGKRETLQKKIARLHDERERFVEDKLKNQAAASTLDAAIIRALRLQAAAKNFSFDK